MTHLKRLVFFVLVIGFLAVPTTQAFAQTGTNTSTFAALQDALVRIVVFLARGATVESEPQPPTESGQTMDPNG